MTNPTTPFSWQMPTSTDLVTDLPADFETFGQAVATSMADLLGGTTGQILSKASNTDMDFTWVTNDVGDITAVTAGTGLSGGGTSGAVSLAIDSTVATLTGTQTLTNKTLTSPALTTPTISTLTTNGDTIYGTGSGAISRLGIGTTGQVLTVAGGLPSWATPAGGSGGLTLISESIPSGATAIDFTSISSDYKQLMLVWTGVYASANNSNLLIRLNNDSSTAYKQREVEVTGTSTVSAYLGDTTDIPCMVRTTSSNNNEAATGYAVIYNANSTTTNKYIETVTSYKRADNSTNTIRRSSIRYVSNSAISQINFQRGETGGTINVTSGGYIQLWGLK